MEIVTDIERLHHPTKLATDSLKVLVIAKILFIEMALDRPGGKTAGLSANQLGFDLRICTLVVSDAAPICLVNPVITKSKGHNDREETCLSLPGIRVNKRRPQEVKVKALTEYMRPVSYKFTGLNARIACHEIDHLDGKLIID